MRVVGVILAAGNSIRFNSELYKQYLKVNGKELIYYSIDSMRKSNCFEDVIAVVDESEYNQQYISKKYNIKCILGGKTRNYSIKNAIDYVKDNYDAEGILFQDSSRPLTPTDEFQETVKLLENYEAIATASEVVDGLISINGQEVMRCDYNLVRTPEAFKITTLSKEFNPNSTCITIIGQIKSCQKYIRLKNKFNFKVTYPEDLFLTEQLVRINYEMSSNVIISKPLGKVLLFGGSGGVGTILTSYFKKNNIEYFSPSHDEIDLFNISVEKLLNTVPFKPDIIINLAAEYANDSEDVLENFDKIMNVNVKSNLVLIKYAIQLDKKINIVVMSSSSSTKGRENLTNYSASKAALNSIVESQSAKLYKQNIFLNALIPEKINTPLIEKLHGSQINSRELLNPTELISAIVKYSTTTEYGKLIHIRKGL